MSMHVAIIGAGAMGKTLAALLSPDNSVIVFKRSSSGSLQPYKKSFLYQEGKVVRTVSCGAVNASYFKQDPPVDVLIMATKVMDVVKAAHMAKHLNPRCVLLLQNGIFDTAPIAHIFKNADVCRGVTTMGCFETSEQKVVLCTRGSFYVSGEGRARIVRLLQGAKIPVRGYQDSQGVVYAKLIFNAVMNPLPIITARGYDILNEDIKAYQIVQEGIREGCAVARALGIRLAFDPMHLVMRIKDGDLAGIAYQGSMQADVAAGRPTEIRWITGALVRQARKLRVKVPVLKKILSMSIAKGA